MRKLITILLLLAGAYCNAQFFAITNPPVNSPVTIGEFISDPFAGSTLSSNWTVNNPGSETVTVSGGYVRVQGGTTTKDASQHIRNSGYGVSLLRNFVVEEKFKINSLGSNGYGVIIGAKSMRPVLHSSSWGFANFKDGNLEIYGGDGSDALGSVVATASLTISVNTTDNYLLRYTLYEGTATVYIENIDQGQSQSVHYDIGFTSGTNDPHRPNLNEYSFGVAGSTDVSFDYVTVSSSEKRYPKYVFVGNSITTGYFTGSALNCYPYKLRTKTSDDVQVMAGGGNSSDDIVSALPEIKFIHPQYVFLEIGTNDIGSAYLRGNLDNIISQLTAAGISVIPMTLVNGGNEATAGTVNNYIATHYPTTYLSIWGGVSTVDGVHPDNAGSAQMATNIKTARPDLFPL